MVRGGRGWDDLRNEVERLRPLGDGEVRRFARVRWTAEGGFKRPPKVIRLSIARRTRGTSRCKV
ncbi:MAG: hypothetical protein ACTS4X_01665, partial [Candidatus Hodgkinia cicadicola]